ncbi:MAG: adenosine kinase [Parachlamydiales bacterium]|jgi:sugar/nucleoside kinase (ribokinase family)
MTGSILGVGALFVDTVYMVGDEFLIKNKMEKGSVAEIEEEEISALTKTITDKGVIAPGGSCANVMRGLAQLGWKCFLTCKIGNDSFGEYLAEDLLSYNIEIIHERVPQPSGRIFCFVNEVGERTMRYIPGAKVKSEDLSQNHFKDKRLVHIEGYALDYGSIVEEAAAKARDAKALVSFDLANYMYVAMYSERIKKILTASVDIVFSNKDEAQELTNLPPRDAAKAISDLCPLAIVTIGDEGCWICKQGEEPLHFPARKVHVKDTTGAGDLFAVGFLDQYLKGEHLQKCAELGAELASRVIQVKGASLKI